MLLVREHTPLQKIEDDRIERFGINLYVKRLDLNHPYISGNKWYKLKYNVEEIKKSGHEVVLTFGGAYSNHIVAVAAAGKQFGFETIGIIRGEEKPLNSPLIYATECGMKLHYVSRDDYRKKESPEFIDALIHQFSNFYLLPEGGSNELAVKGCAEILKEIDVPFDHVCVSFGTGATLAGLILSLKQNQRALGFSSLKGGEFLEDNVRKYIGDSHNNWSIMHDYHFGRYAKTTTELINFTGQFEKRNQVPLDAVYTGKMMFGIYDLIRKGFFVKGETIIALHTGGLQIPSSPL